MSKTVRKGTAQSNQVAAMVLDILKRAAAHRGQPLRVCREHGGRGRSTRFQRGMDELRALLPDDMPNLSMHDLRRTARKLMIARRNPTRCG